MTITNLFKWSHKQRNICYDFSGLVERGMDIRLRLSFKNMQPHINDIVSLILTTKSIRIYQKRAANRLIIIITRPLGCKGLIYCPCHKPWKVHKHAWIFKECGRRAWKVTLTYHLLHAGVESCDEVLGKRLKSHKFWQRPRCHGRGENYQ